MWQNHYYHMRFRFGQLRRLLGLGGGQSQQTQQVATTAQVVTSGPGGPVRAGRGPTMICVCPRCGYTVEKAPGVPCWKYTCPRCGSAMANPNNPFCRARMQTQSSQ